MGSFVSDTTTSDILVRLNRRSDPDNLPEMIALQKEFKVFSEKHDLKQSLALLGIVPTDELERKRWYFFLDKLKTYKSDLPNVSGHDRAIKAVQKNLESKALLPIAVICHLAAEDANVKVSQGRPQVFSSTDHLIISIPTTPRGQPKSRATKAKK